MQILEHRSTDVVLAIDTATEYCSIGLKTQESFLMHDVHAPKGHSALILKLISELLEEQEKTLSYVDYLLVDTGPGSFSGLRIGIGVAQGLSYSTKTPCAGVSSLDALAMAIAIESPEAKWIAPILDAKMNEVYTALYRIDENNNNLKRFSDLIVCSPYELGSLFFKLNVKEEPIFCGGNGSDLFASIVKNSLSDSGLKFMIKPCIRSNAKHLFHAFIAKLGHQKLGSAMDLQPEYVRQQLGFKKKDQ